MCACVRGSNITEMLLEIFLCIYDKEKIFGSRAGKMKGGHTIYDLQFMYTHLAVAGLSFGLL